MLIQYKFHELITKMILKIIIWCHTTQRPIIFYENGYVRRYHNVDIILKTDKQSQRTNAIKFKIKMFPMDGSKNGKNPFFCSLTFSKWKLQVYIKSSIWHYHIFAYIQKNLHWSLRCFFFSSDIHSSYLRLKESL